MAKHEGQGVSVRTMKPDDKCMPTDEMRLFDTVDCAAAQAELEHLLNNVASGCGRVQINGSSPNSACVLISAAELASLERALEILSGTEGAGAMRDQLSKIVAAAGAQAALLRTPLVNVLVTATSAPRA